MAVEARHLNLFPSQLIGNREMMNDMEGNINVYNTPMGFGLPPLSGTTTDTLLPMYGSAIMDSLPAKTPMKADSGLTYALPVSRKRSRDSIHPLMSFANGQILNHTNHCSGSFTFLGEDISLQIQQEQLEIDRFIAQHTEKVRSEIDARQKHSSRRILAAVEEGLAKKWRAKEEEMDKIGKLNWVLEERVKSLCVENQIWRELAQTNEATANALRSNLEQVLAHVKHRGVGTFDDPAALADDAQSCCGSNYDEEWRTIASCGREERESVKEDPRVGSGTIDPPRWCRDCGKEESCVLLLPCRHLCLCGVCGSSVQACPICTTPKNASLRVNMSS
ncbi:BOI-related E3 ubiquitin-protein ligase 3 [Actinidia chinensis var. chinensis]|uniref:BOI-related E3 ubiquitin-protein ligase 3 n=1 Tax=Actinidia chinensis var. chinensis TaxID=1590841 RepID=A0A2R6PR46_ACTCC|nr:BOI-related E3 ubiquitin-protein ligase 3 [Actinidia chinensis var. chinensis]